MKCVICGSGLTELAQSLYDDRYGYPGNFEGWSCEACGHHWLEPALNPLQIKSLYTRYYPRAALAPERIDAEPEPKGFFSWLSGKRASVAFHVPRRVRVLDLGCGFGQSLAYHLSRGCEAEGTEADENVAPVAERSGLRIRIGPFDAGKYELGSFDYVTMDQVLEHLVSPVETLSAARRLLRPDGKILLSTPNGRGWGAKIFGKRWVNWHAPYHQHVFTKTSLTCAATLAGLRIVNTQTVTSSDWLLFQWLHLAAFPSAERPSLFWDQRSSRTVLLRVTFRAILYWHKCGIDALATRAMDFLGVGDNIVALLEIDKQLK